uniref:Uncharacterized protein n=1 Tax=Arundo donax TaxID=35708 RepID=A0A0A9DFM5_ARUDO
MDLFPSNLGVTGKSLDHFLPRETLHNHREAASDICVRGQRASSFLSPPASDANFL